MSEQRVEADYDPIDLQVQLVRERLRVTMWRKGITQGELAAKLGVEQATVSKKLLGSRGFGLDDFFAWTRALDLDPLELLTGVTDVTDTSGNSRLTRW